MGRETQVAALRAVPLFTACSRRELAAVAKASRVDFVDAGQELIREGAPSHDCYVVLAGTATARRNGRSIARFAPGDIVGELGMLLDQPRSATVIADTPLDVLTLDRSQLQGLIDEVPGFGWKLLQGVAARLATDRVAL
jgi:CRP-like cAMP-binding protein